MPQLVPVCVGFKAHLGWLNAVAIDKAQVEPAPVLARRIDLFESADRETMEPYHIAEGWKGLEQGPRPKNPQAIVERGRQKQSEAAADVFSDLREEFKALGFDWQQAVVLIALGAWL